MQKDTKKEERRNRRYSKEKTSRRTKSKLTIGVVIGIVVVIVGLIRFIDDGGFPLKEYFKLSQNPMIMIAGGFAIIGWDLFAKGKK